jgi:hypothetical protein
MGYYKNTYSHPEQRKDGESMFANTHPDQYRRSKAISSGNNSNITRRATTTMTNKSVTNPQPGNNTVTNRRSTTTGTSKSVTNPHPGNNTDINRRSTTTVTDKSVINHPSGKNAGINRSHDQTKPAATSSNRKIVNKKKSVSTVKKETHTKEGDKKEPDHNRQ